MNLKKLIGVILSFLTIYALLSILYVYLQFLWGNLTLEQAIHDLVMLAIPLEVKILIAFPSIIGVIIVVFIVWAKREQYT